MLCTVYFNIDFLNVAVNKKDTFSALDPDYLLRIHNFCFGNYLHINEGIFDKQDPDFLLSIQNFC